jgi:hypothetical protein
LRFVVVTDAGYDCFLRLLLMFSRKKILAVGGITARRSRCRPNHPNRGLCLVVAAADGLPATASSSLIQFLLAAREGGI